MSEEYGTVIIRGPEALLNKLTINDSSAFLSEISKIANVNVCGLLELNADIDALKISDEYIKFDFSVSEWHSITNIFVNNCNTEHIEWYARITDEYGMYYLYALNRTQDKYSYSFEQGGDVFNSDDENEGEKYVENVFNEIENWTNKLPDKLKKLFPEFITTDDIYFDGP